MHAGVLAGQGRLDKLSYLETPSDQNTYLLFRGLFAPRQIQDLLGMSERDLLSVNGDHTDFGSSVVCSRPNGSTRSIVDSFVLFEFAHYLNDQLLKDMDFMSMAHSIETRVPYLDHKLVEYVAALPEERKAPNGMSKYLLIEAMRDDLPREVWDRPKMGFTFPFQEWLREQAEPLAARSSGRSLLDRTAANDVWTAFREGRAHWSRAWALAVLESYDGAEFVRNPL
jgi:asparagine synthase (glutamine-hydrolysing)